ncbi:hypothetical protein [Vibrio parahaemolyticus]|uniref:general secretion pathway protein GspK n=1 Tax=Vibrio parahaemolyticus TaxID=670 RepID=UPI0031FEABEC
MSLKKASTQKGAALIMVLMIVAVMTVAISSIINHNRQLVFEARLLKEYGDAKLAARTIRTHIVKMFTTTPIWTSWQLSEQLKQYQVVPGFNMFGKPFKFEGATLTIQPNIGKVSLVPLNVDMFDKLLKFADVEAGQRLIILDSLEDWMDNDNFVRLNGAEKQFYNMPSLPRNAPIQSIDELRMVRGMTDEIWRKISPHLTLFGVEEIDERFVEDGLLKTALSEFNYEQLMVAREDYLAGNLVTLNKRYDEITRYSGRSLDISVQVPLGTGEYQESFVLYKPRRGEAPFLVLDVAVGKYDY